MDKAPWPLPYDDYENLKIFSWYLNEWLPESKYEVMLRFHNLSVAGFVEKTEELKFDSGRGKDLPWITGWRYNGGRILEKFSEPRKHFVKSTGKEMDTILKKSKQFILCARNSFSIKDDDDNFIWIANENEVSQMQSLYDVIDQKSLVEIDLNEKLRESNLVATDLQTYGETYRRKVDSLQNKVNALTTQNYTLEEQNAELYRQNKILMTSKIEDEAKMEMEQMNAEDRGTMKGMNEIQLMERAGESVKHFISTMDQILQFKKGDEIPPEVFQKFKNHEKELENIKNEMELLKKKKTTEEINP